MACTMAGKILWSLVIFFLFAFLASTGLYFSCHHIVKHQMHQVSRFALLSLLSLSHTCTLLQQLQLKPGTYAWREMQSERGTVIEVTLFSLVDGEGVMEGKELRMEERYSGPLSVHYERSIEQFEGSLLQFTETEKVEPTTRTESGANITLFNIPLMVSILSFVIRSVCSFLFFFLPSFQ